MADEWQRVAVSVPRRLSGNVVEQEVYGDTQWQTSQVDI